MARVQCKKIKNTKETRVTEVKEVDWNIWHDAFMEAYDQIDFTECAKALLYYKSLRRDRDVDRNVIDYQDEMQILDTTYNLKDTVIGNVKNAIIGLSNSDKSTFSYICDTGNVRVTAWRPGADEDGRACIEIQIYLHSTIL